MLDIEAFHAVVVCHISELTEVEPPNWRYLKVAQLSVERARVYSVSWRSLARINSKEIEPVVTAVTNGAVASSVVNEVSSLKGCSTASTLRDLTLALYSVPELRPLMVSVVTECQEAVVFQTIVEE